MASLLLLGLAGLFGGGAISAAKHRAPQRTIVVLVVLMAVALAVALLAFEGNN